LQIGGGDDRRIRDRIRNRLVSDLCLPVFDWQL